MFKSDLILAFFQDPSRNFRTVIAPLPFGLLLHFSKPGLHSGLAVHGYCKDDILISLDKSRSSNFEGAAKENFHQQLFAFKRGDVPVSYISEKCLA
jgi:hypothetical protein